MHRRGRLTAACAVLALAIAIPVVAGAADSDNSTPSPMRPLEQASGVPAILSSQLAIFRTPVSTNDSLGATASLTAQDPMVVAAGGNVDLARRVARQGTAGAWAIPGHDSICLLAIPASDHRAVAPGGTCQPADFVAQGKTFAVFGSAPSVTIIGLMPDGVAKVTAHLENGSSVSAAVNDNSYVIETDEATESISWTDQDGTHSLPAHSFEG